MPALPNASFPDEIWDADSQYQDRDGTNYQSNPKAEDYERIAAELIATQEELRRVQRIVEAEDRHVSSNVTLDATSEFVLVDASSHKIVLTLSDAVQSDGATKIIKKVAGAYPVDIVPAGSDTIDEDSVKTILYQWSTMQIQATETGWYVV